MVKYNYVIIGGGPTGMTLAWILSSHGKKVVLIEKEESLGGCHRVQRVDGFLTEHGPRVYSNSYVNFITILSDMGLSFESLFTEYNFEISKIDEMTIQSLSFSEKMAFVRSFLYLIINPNYGKNVSMKDFMKNNSFSDIAYDYIERVCRLTDGASVEDYTLFQFLQLMNQQLFYKLYQPKLPNDKGLIKIWEDKLKKNDVDILLNSTVTKINYKDKIINISLLKNGSQMNVEGDKYILALPPKPLYNLIISSQGIENSFGDINVLKDWKSKNSYFDYIPLTFHYYKKIDLPKLYGFPRTPWGIVFIILSNYMDFSDEPSKTTISICITMTDIKNKKGKTANQSSKEEIIEYVKEQLPFFPNPDKIIISPNVVRSGDKWINIDTAFVVTSQNRFLDYQSKIDNLHAVGIQNGHSNYNFTSLESSVQNAIHYCIKEIPELKYRYQIKYLNELRYIIFEILIFIGLLYILYKIKNYKKL